MNAATDNESPVLIAPRRIVADTRGEFRTVALAHLERLGTGVGAFVIDMRQTLDLDASGLGILVLLQKRAKDRGLSTRLLQAPERVRNLLKLTMLDFLFEMVE